MSKKRKLIIIATHYKEKFVLKSCFRFCVYKMSLISIPAPFKYLSLLTPRHIYLNVKQNSEGRRRESRISFRITFQLWYNLTWLLGQVVLTDSCSYQEGCVLTPDHKTIQAYSVSRSGKIGTKLGLFALIILILILCMSLKCLKYFHKPISIVF